MRQLAQGSAESHLTFLFLQLPHARLAINDREEVFILSGRVSNSLRARSQRRKLEVKFPQVISTSPRLSIKLAPTQPQLV